MDIFQRDRCASASHRQMVSLIAQLPGGCLGQVAIIVHVERLLLHGSCCFLGRLGLVFKARMYYQRAAVFWQRHGDLISFSVQVSQVCVYR